MHHLCVLAASFCVCYAFHAHGHCAFPPFTPAFNIASVFFCWFYVYISIVLCVVLSSVQCCPLRRAVLCAVLSSALCCPVCGTVLCVVLSCVQYCPLRCAVVRCPCVVLSSVPRCAVFVLRGAALPARRRDRTAQPRGSTAQHKSVTCEISSAGFRFAP